MTVERAWITSHVERCLQQLWDCCELDVDDDGDYPYRWGTAMCWVQVWQVEPHFVRVLAHAAYGVRRTGKLLAELNDVNVRASTVHAHWVNGLVIVEQTLHPAGVSAATLEEACAAVGAVADDIGQLIAAVHGGATPFAPVDEVEEESA